MTMLFWFFVLATIAVLLALAFAFSAFLAWCGRTLESAEKPLKAYVALAILGRYYHRRACTCHVDEKGGVQVDTDCLKWTRVAMRLERARRQMLRAQMQKTGPGVTRARNEHLN